MQSSWVAKKKYTASLVIRPIFCNCLISRKKILSLSEKDDYTTFWDFMSVFNYPAS